MKPHQLDNLDLTRYKERRRGRNDIFVLLNSFRVEWNGILIIVPQGFATDGSSVPSFARGLVDRVTGIEASVCHDWTYSTRNFTKKLADDLFNEMLRADPDVSWLQRNLMVAAVRVFGDQAYEDTELESVQEEYDGG